MMIMSPKSLKGSSFHFLSNCLNFEESTENLTRINVKRTIQSNIKPPFGPLEIVKNYLNLMRIPTDPTKFKKKFNLSKTNFETHFRHTIHYDFSEEEATTAKNNLYLFTDASRKNDNIGLGYTLIFNGKTIYEEIHKSRWLSIVESELQAIYQGIRGAQSYLAIYKPNIFYVVSDCKSAILSIRSTPSNNSTTMYIVNALIDLLKSRQCQSITLKWTKSHSDSESFTSLGNERADELAKIGRQIVTPELSTKIPTAILKEKIRILKRNRGDNKAYVDYIQKNCGQTIQNLFPTLGHYNKIQSVIRRNELTPFCLRLLHGHNPS